MMENKRKLVAVHSNMTISKGKLYTDNIEYQKEIHTLTTEDIGSIPDSEMNKIQQIPVTQSSMITEKESTFGAHATDVEDISQVQRAYIKIKKLHAKDTYVVCAYRLNDQQIQNPMIVKMTGNMEEVDVF